MLTGELLFLSTEAGPGATAPLKQDQKQPPHTSRGKNVKIYS